jgi:superfamily I DNA/RNA helicase
MRLRVAVLRRPSIGAAPPRLSLPRLLAGGGRGEEGCRPSDVRIEQAIPVNFDWLEGRELIAVVGPPGTGKTYTLLQLALGGAEVRVTLEQPVAYFTFVRAMAEDAERRARETGVLLHAATVHAAGARALAAAEGARVSELLVNLRPAAGGPICGKYELCDSPRGWCLGVEESIETLRACAARRYDIEYSSDPYAPAAGNQLFQLLDYAVHVAGDAGATRLLRQLPPRCGAAIEDYLQLLRELGRYDFTTALLEAYRRRLPYQVCERNVCSDVGAALVDEAHDLSPLMWAFLSHALPETRTVAFALDVYQTVYDSLHGARPEFGAALISRVRELGGRVVYLEQSRRVAARVAEVAKLALPPGADPEYLKWRGREGGGDVYLITLDRMLRLVAQLVAERKKVFVLAPTNADVIWAAIRLLHVGIIPRGLKDMPAAVCRRLVAARDLACARAGLAQPRARPRDPDALKLMLSLARRFEHARLGLPDPWGLVCRYLNRAAPALRCARELPLPEDVSIVLPGVPEVYVDTPYTAKGLEADAVFIINRLSFDVEVSPLVQYVALTRSRGDVYIVAAPGKRRWISPAVLAQAKKLQ